MSDFYYQGQLKYITITSANVSGNPAQLAQTIAKWDEESDSNDFWGSPCPKFGSEATGPDFVVTYDASQLDGYDAKAVWSCRVNLAAALDWSHPWTDSTITSAEAIYHEHRTTESRWVLPHIEADAARFLRDCVAEECAMTPKDADKLMASFFDFLRDEAEDCDPDPIGELLSEAMRDAEPISTGIAQLDNALGGGVHKGISILAGDTAAGKTALAAQFALFAANKQEGRVLYCMGDMGGKGSALLRMISCAASIACVSGCKLGRADQWDARERYEGRMAFERVSKGRIDLSDTTDVADLLRTLDASTERISLVVLDYAQAMTYDGRSLAFDPEAASLAVRELREWAHDHDAAVLVLSAYSKSATEAHDRGAAPTMTDILGSSELSYSAEHVLALTNTHDGSGTVTVRDLKHRHGGGSCTLNLDADHGRFI